VKGEEERTHTFDSGSVTFRFNTCRKDVRDGCEGNVSEQRCLGGRAGEARCSSRIAFITQGAAGEDEKVRQKTKNLKHKAFSKSNRG